LLQSLFLNLKQRFSNNEISHNIPSKRNFDPISPHFAVSLGMESKRISKSPSIFDQNPISNRRVSVYSKSSQDHEVTYLGPDLANNLALEMKHRRRFNFGMLDFLYGAYFCCKRQYKCWRKDGNSIHDNYLVYRRGWESFYLDLDVVSILTTVRRMKVLSNLFFNDTQKQLEKYSIFHSINSFSASSIESFKDIPKIDRRKNKIEKIATHSLRVNSAVRELSQHPLSKIDRFLISQIHENLIENEPEGEVARIMKHICASFSYFEYFLILFSCLLNILKYTRNYLYSRRQKSIFSFLSPDRSKIFKY
jgi:hypothetical protein